MATKLDLVFNALTDKATAAVSALLSSVNQGLAAVTANTSRATATTKQFGDTSASSLKQAGGEVERLDGHWGKLVETIQMGVGIDIGGKIVGAIQRIPELLNSSVEKGIEFNNVMESSRLGLAGTFKTFNDDIKNFDDALVLADKALDSLKEKATQSPGTLQELVQAYQGLAPAMFAANVPLNKQVDLVLLMSQTLAGLGIRSEQLLQESKAILTGNITPDAMAAKQLEITAAQVREATAQGRMVEYLYSKMSAYQEAASRATENLTNKQGNLRDALEQTFGKLTEGIFATLKVRVGEMQGAVASPKFAASLNVIADMIGDLISLFGKLAVEGVKHIEAIKNALVILIATLTAVAAATVAIKFSAIFGGIAAVGELILAFRLLLGHITAVTAASGVLTFAGWVGVIVAAVWAGVEAWKAWKAQQEEALSVSNLESANQKLAKSLLDTVEARVKAGAIDAKRAEELRALIQGTIDDQARYGPQLTSDILRAQSRDLLGNEKSGAPKASGRKLTQEEIDATRELANKKAQAALDLKQAELDKERELVERNYATQKTQLEGYLAQRRQLVSQSFTAEAALLDMQIFQLRAQIGAESDPAKKLKLEGELADALSKRKQLGIKYERDLSQITADGEAKRKELRDKAAQEQDALLKKVADDFVQSTYTKRQLAEWEYQQQKKLIERTIKDEEEKNIALAQLHATYLATIAKLDAEKEIRDREKNLKEQRDALAVERAQIQNDYRYTDVQKRKMEIELLEREEKAIRGQADALRDKALNSRESGNEDAAATYEGQANQYDDQARGLGTQRAGMEAQADPESIKQQMRSMITDFQNQVGTLAHQIAGFFNTVIGGAVEGISNSIQGLIRGTMTWGEALANIGNAVIDAIISGFARMVAQWIISQILMLFASKAGQAAAVAASAPAALASTAIWAGPATLATIATFGGAAAAAPVLISASAGITAGTMAGFQGAASAGAQAAAAFADGGLVRGPGTGKSDSILSWLSDGEFIIPAERVRQYGAPFFEGIRSGLTTVSDLAPRMPRTAGTSINMKAGPTTVNTPAPQVQVVVLDNAQKLAEFLRSKAGQTIIYDTVSKNKMGLGIPT